MRATDLTSDSLSLTQAFFGFKAGGDEFDHMVNSGFFYA